MVTIFIKKKKVHIYINSTKPTTKGFFISNIYGRHTQQYGSVIFYFFFIFFYIYVPCMIPRKIYKFYIYIVIKTTFLYIWVPNGALFTFVSEHLELFIIIG